MGKYDILGFLRRHGVVAVLRADAGGDALVKTVEAVARGGVRCIEVTMTTPGALDALQTARERLKGQEVLLGVGSVLDAETCRLALLAGAEFVVTPTFSAPTVRMARRYGKPILVGAFTPTEILHAWEAGADLVKVFPAEFGGAAYLKSVKAPLPQVEMVPTGGVNVDNVAAFFAAGAFAVAAGGNLAGKALVAAEDFAGIEANARAFTEAVERARSV
jgi:2-dehydro-3-deoxyphosphogluconate aldolase/(4S)-4-hydroxy-2-oxoglutarate aldolase